MHVVRSALLAVLATFAMLLVNWLVVPWLNHGFVERGTTVGLIIDLALSFIVAFSLMLIILRHGHGLLIAVFMALCGWTIYFIEVGHLRGMLDSEFPLWYEVVSFIRYPAAIGFALYAHKRGSSKHAIKRATRMVMHTFLTLALLAAASATVASAQKVADKPLFREYKGVRIGMDMNEVRKKLGEPADKGDAQDFFMFSEKESCQVFYDKVHQVMAVSVNYIGDGSGAPLPKVVLGMEIEAKADGSIYKLIRYPASGYWVSYNKTGGENPLITVTMQKIYR